MNYYQGRVIEQQGKYYSSGKNECRAGNHTKGIIPFHERSRQLRFFGGTD